MGQARVGWGGGVGFGSSVSLSCMTCGTSSGSKALTRSLSELAAGEEMDPREMGGSSRKWQVRCRTSKRDAAETQQGKESTRGRKEDHCCCSTGKSAHKANSASGRSS